MALDLVSVNLMALDGVSSAVKVTEPSLKVSTYEFAALRHRLQRNGIVIVQFLVLARPAALGPL